MIRMGERLRYIMYKLYTIVFLLRISFSCHLRSTAVRLVRDVQQGTMAVNNQQTPRRRAGALILQTPGMCLRCEAA